MPLLTDVFLLALGIGLLIAGGEAMVRGAAALARQLGVSSLVVGLTVVAFGTSAPELAVNLTAAIRGDGAIAFGNLIGSNLANVGLILAGAALILRAPWALLLVIPFQQVLLRLFVLPEEAVLEAELGQPYLEFKARVPRWL